MLELLTWTATGLGAGWMVRTLMRSRRNFGVAGDLVTGWLGALVGGWLLRRLNVLAPDNAIGHIIVALTGAAALLAAIRVLRGFVTATSVAVTTSTAAAASLEERLKQLGQFERTVLTDLLSRGRWGADQSGNGSTLRPVSLHPVEPRPLVSGRARSSGHHDEPEPPGRSLPIRREERLRGQPQSRDGDHGGAHQTGSLARAGVRHRTSSCPFRVVLPSAEGCRSPSCS